MFAFSPRMAAKAKNTKGKNMSWVKMIRLEARASMAAIRVKVWAWRCPTWKGGGAKLHIHGYYMF